MLSIPLNGQSQIQIDASSVRTPRSPHSEITDGRREEPQNVKQLKRWYKFWKKHLYVPISEFNLNDKNSSIFKLGLYSVENSKILNAMNVSKVGVKFHATFFSKAHEKFVGRTYSSKLNSFRVFEERPTLGQPLSIFFHTSMPRSFQPVMIIEVEAFELNEKGFSVGSQVLGFLEIDPLTSVESPKTLSLKRGTARMMIGAGQAEIKAENSASTLTYDLAILNNRFPIRHLIPDTVMCGSDEILPGIQNRYIPANAVKTELEQTYKIYLSSIQVMVSESAEKEIQRQVNKISKYKSIADKKANSNIYLRERRVVAVFHNGWTAVNTRGFYNSIVLAEGPPKILMTENNQRNSYQTLNFDGILDIEGFFIDEYGLLGFSLEYMYEISRPGYGRENLKVNVAWLPYYLGRHGIDEIYIQSEMVKGPGKSLNQERLLNLKNIEDSPGIYFSGVLKSTVKMAVSPFHGGNVEDYRRKSQLAQFPDTQENDQLKYVMLAKQKEEELDRHKKLLEEQYNRRFQEMDGRMPEFDKGKASKYFGMDLDNMLKNINDNTKVRDQDFLRHIQALKDENMSLIADKQREFEELKSMLLALKKDKEEDIKRMPQAVDQREAQHLALVEGIKHSEFSRDIEKKAANLDLVYQVREISRADKAFLLQAGVKGLLDEKIEDETTTKFDLDRTIKYELDDPKRASMFMVQFLGIRPHLTLLKRSQNPISNENFYVPTRFYFTMNFFDLPTFKTDVSVFESVEEGMAKLISTQQVVILARESYLKGTYETKEPLYKFEVDPSLTKNMGHYENFIKYLYKKSLNIDIWDADSLMLFGTVKIPLKSLLRQGKPQSILVKEVDIIDQRHSIVKGGLQIILRNIGRTPAVLDYGRDKSKKGSKAGARKIVSKGPVQLPEKYVYQLEQREIITQIKNNEELRIQERIKRHKYKFLMTQMNQEQTLEKLSTPLEVKEKVIEEIANYKAEKKPEILKKVLMDYLSEEKVISGFFGQTEVIEFEFANQENAKQAFTVNIEDPDLKLLEKPELQLITNPTEWKFFVDKKHFPKPPEWNLISKENVFMLNPKEKVTLLFKFISYRKLDPTEANRNLKKKTESDPDLNKAEYISTRSINIFINQLKGRVYGGFSVRVEPHNQIVDHCFRFFERENRSTTLKMPSLYHMSSVPINKPLLHVTYPKSTVEWVSDREIGINLKTPSAANILHFNLIAYDDSYCSEIIGNWLIELHSLSGFHLYYSGLISMLIWDN